MANPGGPVQAGRDLGTDFPDRDWAFVGNHSCRPRTRPMKHLEREFCRNMNKLNGAWLGTFTLAAVLYFGVFSGFKDLAIFFNAHALILVFGGTLAVMFMSYPLSVLSDLFDFMVYGFFLKKPNNLVNVSANLLTVIYHAERTPRNIEMLRTEHMFIKEGLRLLQDPEIDADDVHEVMNSIKESFYRKYFEDAKIMTNVSKFPPALGLLGAATGMIDMMMNLGSGGTAAIGAAMATALTATFWGIAAANFVFLPLADYAARLAEEDAFLRECIMEAMVMAKEGRSFRVISDIITSKLPVVKRMEVKKLLNIYIQTYPMNTARPANPNFPQAG